MKIRPRQGVAGFFALFGLVLSLIGLPIALFVSFEVGISVLIFSAVMTQQGIYLTL